MHQKVSYKNFKFFKCCSNYADILEEGRTAIVLPIHKKETNNPDNYRGISFLNTGYKMYSKSLQSD
jgi:hypothetical protein